MRPVWLFQKYPCSLSSSNRSLIPCFCVLSFCRYVKVRQKTVIALNPLIRSKRIRTFGNILVTIRSFAFYLWAVSRDWLTPTFVRLKDVIVDYRPENFHEFADKPFFYSIDGQLKYDTSINRNALTLSPMGKEKCLYGLPQTTGKR